ncbi:conserved hypothetical protein [Ricinus communis]|uniref:Uncharacterized protein n=1 Tax=Ricinus communis TaxID=3988 RepID=B9RI99_RICCO|nr:conserved hypothetical protein [Ricinus communis]
MKVHILQQYVNLHKREKRYHPKANLRLNLMAVKPWTHWTKENGSYCAQFSPISIDISRAVQHSTMQNFSQTTNSPPNEKELYKANTDDHLNLLPV